MKILFFITLSLIIFSNTANAGKVYIWTDKKGVEHITTAPPPENAKIKHKAATRRDSPDEIANFQRQQKAQNDRYFREWQAGQNKRTVQTTTFSPPETSTQEKKRQAVPAEWEEHKHTGAMITSTPTPRGVIDVRTGQYYTPAAGGVIDPRTGTFHQEVAGGYVNTRTGEFSPKVSP